jgi:hypothetical protein
MPYAGASLSGVWDEPFGGSTQPVQVVQGHVSLRCGLDLDSYMGCSGLILIDPRTSFIEKRKDAFKQRFVLPVKARSSLLLWHLHRLTSMLDAGIVSGLRSW